MVEIVPFTLGYAFTRSIAMAIAPNTPDLFPNEGGTIYLSMPFSKMGD
jgi:hypothetical protein